MLFLLLACVDILSVISFSFLGESTFFIQLRKSFFLSLFSMPLYLQPVPLSVHEEKEKAAQRIFMKMILHKIREPVV